MKANAVALVALFEKKMRLEVPLFQRPYVWSETMQWAPLWEDIERKFSDYLEGRSDVPVHFLGAIVLDQKQTPATHVERRLVIDGQQRLTTLQVFLNAFRDFCRSEGASALADECTSYTLNKGMMPDPAVDKFKVWPTQMDRPAFMAVVESGSPIELNKRDPLVKQKWARKFDDRPKLVECYLYFYSQLEEFFLGAGDELPLACEYPIEERLEQCFQALRNALMVVAIDLEQGDDAQVIFETLNARGQALLPADLLRNYIFLRATRRGESAEVLYGNFWEDFDAEYWQERVSQGRLNRPRSDLFMQHFLASQQTTDIPIGHLYVEYRHWIEKTTPFATVEDELKVLARSRTNFRSLHEADVDKPYSSLAQFLKIYDIGTAYPLLLLLLDSQPDPTELRKICKTIESYLIRRSVCLLTNKNYNRVFLTLARNLKSKTPTAADVQSYFRELRGESTEWPSDESFRAAFEGNAVYHTLNAPRLVYLLTALNNTFASSKTETVTVTDPLTIEHLMPQSWLAHWTLPDGSTGIDEMALFDMAEDDERAILTRNRNNAVHRIGNLTLVRQGLNSALSNGNWSQKKQQIMDFSLLPINLPLQQIETWDEAMIDARSKSLFSRALTLWPRQTPI